MKKWTDANLRAKAIVDRRRANWPNAKHTGRMAGFLPRLVKDGLRGMSPDQLGHYNRTMIEMGWPEKTEKPKWRK